MKKGVIVKCLTGEVIFENQKSRGVLSKSLKVNMKTKIITGLNSYAEITDNPDINTNKQGSYIILFPESESIIDIEKGFLKEFEILNGMAKVAVAENKIVKAPFVEFYGGIAWFEILKNVSTKIANTRELIFNKNTNEMLKVGEKKQILITQKDVGKPEPMDDKFLKAEKIIENIGAFYGFSIYENALKKSDEMLAVALSNLKIIAEKTGQNFDVLKENAIKDFENYKRWVSGEIEKCNQDIEKIKNFSSYESCEIPVNKEIKYQELNLKIISVKKEIKDDGVIKLSIKINVKNNSKKEHFIFWNEITRITIEKNEIFLLDDYSLDTDLLSEKEYDGYLFFNLKGESEKIKKINFEIGKNFEKLIFKIDLTEKKGV